MNIIVADDSFVVRSIVKKAIAHLGHQILQAVHGGEVIDILEKMGSEVDLILLDWNMPVMDGFQALETMKGDPRFSSIPVMMLTSESDEKKIQMAYDAGAAGYVEKPFTPEELVRNIEKAVKD